MTMPLDLIIVRHGESEGNIATHASRNGDDTYYTPEFRTRHSSYWRLTPKGVQQAIATGGWLRDNFPAGFDRYIVSEHIRAKETAGHLSLPDAKWFSTYLMTERNWGELDLLPHTEQVEKYGHVMQSREQDSVYWTPPGGESIAMLCLRVQRMLDTLHRECADKQVIIVCHGEVMWAFRMVLEHLSQIRFQELDDRRNPEDKINNCQIIHYSRKSPETGKIHSHMNWMRSLAPCLSETVQMPWREIIMESYSNDALLAEVATIPRIFDER